MSPRHDPESYLATRDDDGTSYRDPADLAHELDRRDDSDACLLFGATDDE